MPAPLADETAPLWRDDPVHRGWLRAEALRQLAFFRPALRAGGLFDSLDAAGTPIPGAPQELHATTRMVHSFALGRALGAPDCDAVIDAGLALLRGAHHDSQHGGWLWSVDADGPVDTTKLAYGHVFVLLAASSAMAVGHPGAAALLDDAAEVLDRRFWDGEAGLLRDEYARDWQPFSTYRGMNANMHGVEALLAAFEATGHAEFLTRAGRILDFFTARMAPAHGWRIPEHYTGDWQVDDAYRGNPMFRPPGTTPGHSVEFARLILQHWDLSGRPATDAPARARTLAMQALADGWLPGGGLAYTLHPGGGVAVADRYWWPVTEAIGAVASLQKADPRPQDEAWYRRLWTFADAHLIDHAQGGWFPEIGAGGAPAETVFRGKPDIYHSLQAALLPLVPDLSRPIAALERRGD